MAYLNPYLSFDNQCREAMNFYKECLGGTLELQTVAESPEMAAQMPDHFKDHILHSALTSGNMLIMASDLNQEKHLDGNTMMLCLNCETEDELNRFFTGLSKNGKITQPIADMPWGAKYAALTDQYGKHWVFNFQKP